MDYRDVPVKLPVSGEYLNITYIHNQFYKCLGVMISRFNISLCMQRCANVLAPSAGLPCTGDLNRSAFNLVPHVYYHYFSPSILFH